MTDIKDKAIEKKSIFGVSLQSQFLFFLWKVWKISLINDDTRLITGSGDSELRVYELKEAENNEV